MLLYRDGVVVQAGLAGPGQEGLQVLPDQLVENGFLRAPGPVETGEGRVEVVCTFQCDRRFHVAKWSKARAGSGGGGSCAVRSGDWARVGLDGFCKACPGSGQGDRIPDTRRGGGEATTAGRRAWCATRRGPLLRCLPKVVI